VKPVLVVDFFNPGNPKKIRATGVMKVALDHFLSVQGIPLLARLAKRTVEYSLTKKDISYFNDVSAALGMEATRLFARMGWNFDSDINHLLVESMEQRIANPLVESSYRERENLERNFDALWQHQGEDLGLFLRRRYEDRIRKRLDLGNKAIFAADLARYGERRADDSALAIIRDFNCQPHLPTVAWSKIVWAWNHLRHVAKAEHEPELQLLHERVKQLYPGGIPADQQAIVRRLLGNQTHFAGLAAHGSSQIED
jgi:hypothetical protein